MTDRSDWLTVLAGVSLALSCGGEGRQDDAGAAETGITLGATGEGDGDSMGMGDETFGDLPKLDVGTNPGIGCQGSDLGCTNQIDILFVIDNSGTMAVEQANLARNFPLLIEQLENLEDARGRPVAADVQMMVTTTDFDNPLCRGPGSAKPEDYEPSLGAPTSTTCLERENRFSSRLGAVEFEACTDVCLNAEAAPSTDPFIAFKGAADNIPDAVTPTDINGDGTEDSPVAQALACIGPQGVDGCGYEAPLESMMQALYPGAAWNTGDRPFLRPGALLAIVVITDEVDCSLKDASIMTDDAFQEIEPATGQPRPTSAVCWNAGVTCDEPDENGVYASCTSSDNGKLQPISRYVDYLTKNLREEQGKEIVMLGILGVPLVTEHNEASPFQPTAGGVFDLVYRDWRDGLYPDEGDILPPDADAGRDAAFQQFDFGIGPGCTGQDEDGDFTGQAIPPVRIKEVCEALNIENDDGTVDIRCCIESICDTDYSAAIRCLTGTIQQTIVAPG